MLQQIKELVLEVTKAILPIVLVVIAIQIILLQSPLQNIFFFISGALMVTTGLLLFLIGVRISLLPIGELIGSELVSKGSLVILLVGAFIFGLVVTLAEPDVRVLALQVDFASGGAMNSYLLILAVAIGVAIFTTLAILRILLNVPIAYILGIGYLSVVVLSLFTPQEFVAISFDAGGVTTGPMAVPFILALGIGSTSVLGGKSSIANSFGLIGIASIGPVISVMLLGVLFG